MLRRLSVFYSANRGPNLQYRPYTVPVFQLSSNQKQLATDLLLFWLQDLDECVLSTPCTKNKFCVNTEGSFRCLSCDKVCYSPVL
jgi:uncharacterized UBP type Zn finger protein